MPAQGDDPRRSARPSPPPFRPRFTIALLWFALFLVLFELLQVLPSLIELLGTMEPGPAQQAAAERLVREESNLRLSLVLALAATALGSWRGVLPGTRS